MGVIRTLINRCEEIVTEEEDKEEERGTIMKALEACGYPRWTVTNVKEMEKKEQKKGYNKRENDTKMKEMVVLPYVRGASEKLARIFKKRGIVTAIKPHSTLKSLLVHPKDKTDPKEGVYTIDGKGCDKKYIGETKRKLKVRVKEHRSEAKSVKQLCTQDTGKRQSQSEMWGSALTDHAVKEKPCHRLGECEDSRKRREDLARGIKEAIYIRKLPNLNRDEGEIPSIPFIRQPPWGSCTHLEGEGEQRLQKLAQYYHHLAVIHLLQYCVITVLKKSPGW